MNKSPLELFSHKHLLMMLGHLIATNNQSRLVLDYPFAYNAMADELKSIDTSSLISDFTKLKNEFMLEFSSWGNIVVSKKGIYWLEKYMKAKEKSEKIKKQKDMEDEMGLDAIACPEESKPKRSWPGKCKYSN